MRPLLLQLLQLSASVSPKIKDVVEVRKGLIDRWKKADLGANRLWFHVSSVGELEQVRPALEILGARGYSLVLSYFSSSVPKLVKDWSFVRHADYLPLDKPEEMADLMRIIGPRVLVLNRYDLWPEHLRAAKDWNVPVVVVNASTPPLGWKGYFSLLARRALFRMIGAWTFVDAAAAAAWEPYISGRSPAMVTGNPRVDRALERVERSLKEQKAEPRLRHWKRQDFCLVAGSTWEEDEAVLLETWNKTSRPRSLVIVPHEPDAPHLEKLEKLLAEKSFSFVRFSKLDAESGADVLIVDERGYLAELYGLGSLAYVGGGFKKEVHSIIEPVAHGIPVAFGPHYKRSPEAVTLQAAGAGFALPKKGGAALLSDWIGLVGNEGPERARAKEAVRVFLQIHRGAGERMAEFLQRCLGDATGASAPLDYADKDFSGSVLPSRRERS